jgi:hypothetical protein
LPIVVLFLAVILIAAGINNQIPLLTSLVKQDLEPTDGSVSFGIWILAIGIIGILGYSKSLKPISNGFLVLVFIGIIFAAQNGSTNNGFFTNLQKAFGGQGSANSTAQEILTGIFH